MVLKKSIFTYLAPYQPSLSSLLWKKHNVIFSPSFFRPRPFVCLWNKGYSSQLGSQAMWQALQRGRFGHRETFSLLCQHASSLCLLQNSKERAMETTGVYYSLSETSPPGPQRAQQRDAFAFIHRPLLWGRHDIYFIIHRNTTYLSLLT